MEYGGKDTRYNKRKDNERKKIITILEKRKKLKIMDLVSKMNV